MYNFCQNPKRFEITLTESFVQIKRIYEGRNNNSAKNYFSFIGEAICNKSFAQESGEVVKRLACGVKGSGFDSWSRRYDFRDWLSPASKSGYG